VQTFIEFNERRLHSVALQCLHLCAWAAICVTVSVCTWKDF